MSEREIWKLKGSDMDLIEQIYLSQIMLYSFFYLNIFSLEIREVYVL